MFQRSRYYYVKGKAMFLKMCNFFVALFNIGNSLILHVKPKLKGLEKTVSRVMFESKDLEIKLNAAVYRGSPTERGNFSIPVI